MWDNTHLKQMVEMSAAANESINRQKATFDEMFKGVLANAPIEHRGILEKVQATTNLAITLAKQGKHVEASEILNNLQNECKNNKP